MHFNNCFGTQAMEIGRSESSVELQILQNLKKWPLLRASAMFAPVVEHLVLSSTSTLYQMPVAIVWTALTMVED